MSVCLDELPVRVSDMRRSGAFTLDIDRVAVTLQRSRRRASLRPLRPARSSPSTECRAYFMRALHWASLLVGGPERFAALSIGLSGLNRGGSMAVPGLHRPGRSMEGRAQLMTVTALVQGRRASAPAGYYSRPSRTSQGATPSHHSVAACTSRRGRQFHANCGDSPNACEQVKSTRFGRSSPRAERPTCTTVRGPLWPGIGAGYPSDAMFISPQAPARYGCSVACGSYWLEKESKFRVISWQDRKERRSSRTRRAMKRMQRPFSKESAGPMLFRNPMTITRGNSTTSPDSR